MFNINAIVPIKRMNDLAQAYFQLKKYEYSDIALKNALATYLEHIEPLIKRNTIQNDIQPSIFFGYRDILSNNGEFSHGEIGFSNYSDYIIDIKSSQASDRNIAPFIQSILMSVIKSSPDGSFRFRLADPLGAGANFGQLIKIAESNKRTFGGKIYSDSQDIKQLFEEIEGVVADNISKIGGMYDSVFEYNKNNEKKIPIYTVVIFNYDSIDEYAKRGFTSTIGVCKKAGVNIIFTSVEKIDNNLFTLELLNDDTVSITKNDFQIRCKYRIAPINISDIEKASEQKKIDTIATSYFDVENIKMDMDSTQKLSIPFAVNEYGEVQCLEIGGTAPAHALISGETGSGKSVLLHTIIDSITMHYHPNDVEIWAIDYKAVEFACYVESRTPHITVIGQDKSDDFSFSLLELVNKEYEHRKKLFVEEKVKNFNEYRRKGLEISRIIIVIDEFHNLTQAVQQEPKYKTMLENLLSEMRAMGMAFVFCSQTISSGLQGLTEKGKNQIGCRLCMKQSSIDEIKQTLAENISLSSEYVESIKGFGKGQVLYKKAQETGYTYDYLNVLFIPDEMREKAIENVYKKLDGNYTRRKEVICKNSERFDISEKSEHSLWKFINGDSFDSDSEGFVFYPAAPTTLEDEFAIEIDRNMSNNIIICGEDDDLRESMIMFSVLSLLANSSNRVNVSIFDKNNSDSKSLNNILSKIQSNNLNIYFGPHEAIGHLLSLKKLHPMPNGNNIEILYGLHKIKSLLYMLQNSDDDEQAEPKPSPKPQRVEKQDISGMDSAKLDNLIEDLINSLGTTAPTHNEPQESKAPTAESLDDASFADIKTILMNLFEHGPDLGYFNIVILNNAKQIKQSECIKTEMFEYRIGTEMSADDSYTLFSTEYFVRKADEKTVVFYSGSPKKVKTLRPYIFPDDDFINKFNERIKSNEQN